MVKIDGLHRKILLELNRKELVSGQQLAESCEVSVKTIRREIAEINYNIDAYGCEVSSMKARGYYLKVKNRDRFNELLSILSDEERRSSSFRYENYVYRMVWIFLNSKEVLRIDDLTKYFSCSKSTVQKYLHQVKQILSNYRLEIVSKPNYGLYLEGNEWDIRLCMIDQFGKIENDSFFRQNNIRGVYSVYNEGWPVKNDYEAIVKSVFNYHLKNYNNSSVPFLYLTRLYYYVKLSYCRRDKVEGIYHITKVRNIVGSNTRKVCDNIFNDLDIAFDRTTDEADKTALTVLMAAYRTRINGSERPSRSFIYIDNVRECLIKVNERYDRIVVTDELVYNVCRFLWSCEYRRDYGLAFDEENVFPVVQDALAVGDFCYDLGIEMRKKGIEISDRESLLMYFIFVNAFNSYRRQELDHRILMCSRYGRIYSESIANRVITRFRKFIGKLNVCEYNDINKEMIKDYDVIITDIRDEFEKEYDIPIVYSDFFRQYENNTTLNDYFSSIQKNAIRKQISPDHVHYGVNVRNKQEVFDYIYSLYDFRGISRKQFMEELYRRDEYLDSNRHNGSAIISGHFDEFNESVEDIIIPKKPLTFNGKTVYLIVFYNRGIRGDMNIINDIYTKSVIVNTPNENRQLAEKSYGELFDHVDMSY